jgi:murein DD-endopeptidase MepM/ murein hydrolase activator NlpD
MRAALLSIVLVTFSLAPDSALAGECWRPPTTAAVADPFRSPGCPWCPGNRGIEYDTRPGDPVRAVAAGEVTFAGEVAGTRYVVVRHADGLRVTYGNIAGTVFVAGDTVVAGTVIGVAGGRLHFGVRRGEEYIDPTPLIGVEVGVARLLPTDGTAGTPSPPAVVRCPV